MLNDFYLKSRQALLSPLFLLALAIMIFNDHFLKDSGWLPGVVTGKLSDLSFLFFFPVVLSFLFQIHRRNGIAAIYILCAIFFSALNLFPPFSQFVERIFANLGSGLKLWPDNSDLLALPVAWISFQIFYNKSLSENKAVYFLNSKYFSFLRLSVISISILACLYTSPADSHIPIYKDIKDFREGKIQVNGPSPIETRGKITLINHILLINEPNKGIHLVDVSDKKNPKQLSFIEIPGNIDMAVKDNILYADSLMDLLVITIENPQKPVVLKRILDQFTYDPLQTLPEDARIRRPNFPENDNNQIIVGWKKR